MKPNLNSQQILPIVFVSGLLIVSLTSNSFLTSAFGQPERQFSSKLMGKNEVPPVNTTATGAANFTLSRDGKSIHYILSVHNISGVLGAHIHAGTSNQNGPILFTLLNSSMLVSTSSNNTNGISTGTITSSDIRGNLTNKPIMPHVGMLVGSMRELISLLTSGTTYVNVYTQQHQNGEIRGQIGPSNMTASPPSSNMTASPPSSNMTASPPNNFNNSTLPITKSTTLSLGKPFINYTESDKSPTPQQKFINGTHILVTTYAGNSTIRNIPITDTGTVYIVQKANNNAYSYGRGVILAKNGSGMSMYTFSAQGHYGVDGKLHDIGVSFGTNPTGSLSFLSNTVGIYKDWYDRSGHGMTRVWLWK